MELAAGFRLADREIRPREGRIVTPAGAVRVEPKTMAVLVALARHGGEVVSRRQIHAEVWPRQAVTDDVLTRCIGQLRRALGDDPRRPRLLETIPRRGYRLLVRIEPGAAAADALLVLPFRSYSADIEPWLADGLTELLITRLACLRDLRVISRTTAMTFRDSNESVPDIATRIGATWVVEGSVLGSADRLQVVAQLIDARSDTHVWADEYLREVSDLLLLQNTLAEHIATAVQRSLGSGRPREEWAMRLPAAAMRDYLHGRHLLSRRASADLREALACFARVSESAPDYAPAWASQAEVHMLLAHYGAEPSLDAVPRTHALLARALTLDPHQPIALSCRGGVALFFERDFAAARRYLHEALERLPNYAIALLTLGNVHAVCREFDEAEAWLGQALLVDPLDVGISMNLGDHRILAGRFAQAMEALEQAQRLAPGHRPSGLRLAWAAALAGDAGRARAVMDGLKPDGGVTDVAWLEYGALVAAALDDAAGANESAAALEALAGSRFVSPWGLARAFAAAGRRREAIALLGRCVEERSSSVPFMAVTPAFRTLHGEPAFAALLQRAGLG